MTLGKYLWAMTLIACCTWALWLIVVYRTNPFTAGWFGFLLFYVTLFFAVTSSASSFGLLGRLWLVRQEAPDRHALRSVRQGSLFGIALVGGLLMTSWHIFTTLNGALFLGLLVAVEFFALSLEAPSASSLDQE